MSSARKGICRPQCFIHLQACLTYAELDAAVTLAAKGLVGLGIRRGEQAS